MKLLALVCVLAFVKQSEAATCVAGQKLTGTTCSDCPANTFAAAIDATSCTACAAGFYSGVKASKCEQCIKGYQPASTACNACAKGFYKDTDGTSACTQCPADAAGVTLTTAATASISQTLCTVCPDGYFKAGAICTKCPVGYYSTGGAACSMCTATKPHSSTTATGSTAVAQCQCDKGYNLVTTTCTACAAGSHKDVVSDATTCTTCATGTTTIATASTAATACVCVAGYYKSSTMSACAKCPVGTYSANAATACTTCPTGTSTTVDGQSACVCNKGYYGYEDQCAACPIGNYKTAVGSLTTADVATHACVACTTALTTASTGATAASECIVQCVAGKYGSSTACTDCPQGQYQPSTNQKACISCGGTGFTTASTGKSAHTDCQCTVGYYGTYQKCTACPKGTYQDTSAQISCKQCPDDKVTTAVASTASSACIDEPSGSQSYRITFKIINRSWTSNFETETNADYIALKLEITNTLEAVFEGIAVGVATVFYGTQNWDFSEGSIDVRFDAVFSNDNLHSRQIENAIKNSLSASNTLPGSDLQLNPDSIDAHEHQLEWYVILAIVLGCLVVLALFIVIIVLCVMHMNKRDRRGNYPQHYGDRDRMYDSRARGRDPGVINRSGPYGPHPGTGFDERKESPTMFPRPSKNMWQLKDNGWSPRHYPNEMYTGAPYGSSPYNKKPYNHDDHMY